VLPNHSIIYQDEQLVAINKPSGLLVHRSPIDKRETRFALQEVRNLIGQRVYPIHRLDKPTSGVLLFALSPEMAKALSQQFQEHQVQKTYHALVRGFSPEQQYIDHALKLTQEDARLRRDQEAVIQEAQTQLTTLAQTQVNAPIDRYPTSRFSFVELMPKTGRRHQLRRHMKHLANPIIGDAKYGKGKYNRYFAEHFGANRLLLHCSQLSFSHPLTGQEVMLEASFDEVFLQLLARFEWHAVNQEWEGFLDRVRTAAQISMPQEEQR